MSGCEHEELTCCDLGKMSEEQLERLRADVTRELETRASEDQDKFLESDEFKALKKEYKALKKEFKALSKDQTVELTLPLKFKIKMHPQELAYAVEGHCDSELYDLWDVEVSGKVMPSDQYDKNMLVNLQGVVDNAMQDVCSEVLYLNPEAGQALDEFVKKLNDFRNRLDNRACAEDLE